MTMETPQLPEQPVEMPPLSDNPIPETAAVIVEVPKKETSLRSKTRKADHKRSAKNAPEDSAPKAPVKEKQKKTASRLGTAGKTRVRKQEEAKIREAEESEAKVKATPEEETQSKFGTHFFAGAELQPIERHKEDTASHNPKPENENIENDFAKLMKVYEKKGLGEIAAQLGALPEFRKLPEDQKLLVMQGVSDKLLEHVRREGDRGFRQEYAESGLLKKVWKNMTKNAVQAKHEKKALAHTTGFEAAAFIGQVAPGLIKVYEQSGLNAFVKDDGTVATMYSSLDKNYLVDDTWRFNSAATNLARTPEEWNKPGSTWSERRAYKKTFERFEKEKAGYLNELVQEANRAGIPNPRAYAAEVVANTEAMVKTMRLLTSDPKTLDRLEAIGKNPSWLRGFKDSAFERTIGTTAGYVGTAGRLARMGTVALTGIGSTAAVAAAPIIASIVGGFRGNARATKELRENDRLARVGETQNGKTAHRMSDVSRKLKQLDAARTALATSRDAGGRMKALEKVKTYADFIEAKLELGQVNFGGDENQFVRQYELLQSLQKARTAIAIQSQEPIFAELLEAYEADPDGLYARTSKLGARFQTATEKARKGKVRAATLKGMGLGAIAGSTGVAVRYFGEYMGWFGSHAAPEAKHHTASVSNPIKTVSSAPDTTWKFGDTHSLDGKGKTFDTPPIAKPEGFDTLHHSAAHVKFSSKGIQQTLLNFRHSAEFKHLTPDQQKFFEGNVAKISEEIKGYRPDALDGKESISFSEGSEFGVSAEGKVYVADKLSGKTTILGHFEGSSFKADADEADLKYIDTDAKRAASIVKKAPRATPESVLTKKAVPFKAVPLEPVKLTPVVEAPAAADTVIQPTAPEADTFKAAPLEPVKMTPVLVTPEVAEEPLRAASMEDLRATVTPVQTADTVSRTINEAGGAPGASLRDYVSGQEFTPRMKVEMDSLAGVALEKTTDYYFSYASPSNPLATVAGHNSPAWLSFSSRSAKEVLATELTTYNSQFRPFFQEIKILADRFPVISKEQSLGAYLKKIYRMLIEEQVRLKGGKK